MYITLSNNTTLLDPKIDAKKRHLAADETKKKNKAEDKTQVRSKYYKGYFDPRKLTGTNANYHKETNRKGATV